MIDETFTFICELAILIISLSWMLLQFVFPALSIVWDKVLCMSKVI